MLDFAKNKVKRNSLENQSDERDYRWVSIKAMALESKSLHSYCSQSWFHKIFDRIARKDKDQIRVPYQQYNEVFLNPLFVTWSEGEIQYDWRYHWDQRSVLWVHSIYQRLHQK